MHYYLTAYGVALAALKCNLFYANYYFAITLTYNDNYINAPELKNAIYYKTTRRL